MGFTGENHDGIETDQIMRDSRKLNSGASIQENSSIYVSANEECGLELHDDRK